MNAEAEGHPIALTGRVPCKVSGPVAKGDLLVSSSIKGHARVDNNAGPRTGKAIGSSEGGEAVSVLVNLMQNKTTKIRRLNQYSVRFFYGKTDKYCWVGKIQNNNHVPRHIHFTPNSIQRGTRMNEIVRSRCRRLLQKYCMDFLSVIKQPKALSTKKLNYLL